MLILVILLFIVVFMAAIASLVCFVPFKWERGRYAWSLYRRWKPLLSRQSDDKRHQHHREILCEVGAILDDSGVGWYASEGTGLGLFCEGDVIMGDTDVDFAVLNEDEERFHDTVMPRLLSEGFRVSKSRPLKMDFIGAGQPCMSVKWPRTADEFLDTVRPLQRLGTLWTDQTFPVPTEAYFERLYGPNWRTPMSGKYSKPENYVPVEKK